VIAPALSWLANFSWFVGVAAGALFYRTLTRQEQSSASAVLAATGSQGPTEDA
jgi:cytosine/uracil/thiamine/allantoin permease